ncbi:Hypothetical predicted protein [Pelobates cultripes]|uniref:Uncharacterized protein n=1 Tax=Pelobates cultripes TaxID=61616 RepID=A0AAD1VQP7_PELCU|nr:Hypothetical predicted protein [Pelobates cultripes]
MSITDEKKFCVHAPLGALEEISPWLSLKTWMSRGVTRIQDLCYSSGIIPFLDLQQQFQLPNSLIFTYLQLKSMILTKVSTTPNLKTTPSNPLKTLIERCHSAPTKPKALSLCYKTLSDQAPPRTFKYVMQWEKENMPRLSDEQWLQSLSAL